MAISTGSMSLATDAQRSAFTDSIEQAACAGMSGTCSVSLLSWRRRQLSSQQQVGSHEPNLRELNFTAAAWNKAPATYVAQTDARAPIHFRHLQSDSATISLSREYAYSASSASDQTAASLVGSALSSQGASVTSSAIMSLSASTAVIVVGDDSDASVITSAMGADTLAAALSSRLPGVEVEVEAPTLSAPPPPPPRRQPSPPADLPPPPPPPARVSVVEEPAAAIGATKQDKSSNTVLIVIVAAAAGVALCLLAAVAVVLRRRRLSHARRDKRFESQRNHLRGPASASNEFFAAGLESQAPVSVSVQMHTMDDMEMQSLPFTEPPPSLPGYKQSGETQPRPRQNLPCELMPSTMDLVTVGHI